MQFKRKVFKSQRVPYTVYADFECYMTEPTDEQRAKGFKSVHKPSGAAYLLVSQDPQIPGEFKVHRGTDSVEWLLNELFRIERTVKDRLKNPTPEKTPEDSDVAFDQAEAH